ncbi:Endothelin-converting enzyme 1, partial [Gryllus bimaculatus]
MLLAVGLLFLLMLILAIVLIAVHTNLGTDQEASRTTVSYCAKEECVKSARGRGWRGRRGLACAGAELVQALDRRVDPCADFYRFACGRWARQHPVPDRRASASWFSERGQRLDLSVTEVLKGNGSAGEPAPLQLVRDLYASCVDVAAQEEAGLRPLAEALARAGLALAPPGAPDDPRPGRPALPLGAALARAQRSLSLDVLLELSTVHDPNDTVRMLRVAPAPTVLLSTQAKAAARALVPRREGDDLQPATGRLKAEAVLKAEIAFMARVVRLLANADRPPGAPPLSARQAELIATKIRLFEAFLRNYTTRGPKRPKSLNTTWYEFQKILDSGYAKENSSKEKLMDLEQYVETLSEGLNHSLDFYNDVIFLSDVVYFIRLSRMLAKEGPIVAQRYLWWRMVFALLPYTTPTLRGYERHFHQQLLGPRPRSPRSRVCTSFVKDLLPAPVSYAMGHKYPLDDVVTMVEEILSDIRKSFQTLVRDAQWMDRETQDATIDKMFAVTSFIGYPEWVKHPEVLDHRYEGLQMDSKKYLMNYVNVKSFTVKQIIDSLGVNDSKEPPDLWETIDPIQVNAFYTRLTNSIVIPAGILQRPFFRRGHGALSYGAIGAILGHELTHGFDSEGRKYDKHGRHSSWWSEDSVDEYNRRAECFVRQYGRFRMPGRHKAIFYIYQDQFMYIVEKNLSKKNCVPLKNLMHHIMKPTDFFVKGH